MKLKAVDNAAAISPFPAFRIKFQSINLFLRACATLVPFVDPLLQKSPLFNRSARKALFACVVYTNTCYNSPLNFQSLQWVQNGHVAYSYQWISGLLLARNHNRGRRPQARGPRKTIEKDKCAIFSENCATLNVTNSRGYTQICVGLGDSLQAGLKARLHAIDKSFD